MTPAELDRWTTIARTLEARGHFALTDREGRSLRDLIAAASGHPAPTAICDCRGRLMGLLGSANVLRAQLSSIVDEALAEQIKEDAAPAPRVGCARRAIPSGRTRRRGDSTNADPT